MAGDSRKITLPKGTKLGDDTKATTYMANANADTGTGTPQGVFNDPSLDPGAAARAGSAFGANAAAGNDAANKAEQARLAAQAPAGPAGVNGYNPMDPGTYENWYAAHASDFDQGAQASRAALGAYTGMMGSRGDLVPQLDQAYADAEARTAAQINAGAAARGNWYSSMTAGQQANALSGLEADKARKMADYRLQVDQNNRGWAMGLGQMSNAYDASSLNWLNAGGHAAGTAQDAASGRWQQEYNGLMGLGNAAGNVLSTGYTGMYTTDQGLLTDATNASVGAGNTGASNAAYNAETQQAQMNAMLAQMNNLASKTSSSGGSSSGANWGTGPTGGSGYSTGNWGGGWGTDTSVSSPYGASYSTNY